MAKQQVEREETTIAINEALARQISKGRLESALLLKDTQATLSPIFARIRKYGDSDGAPARFALSRLVLLLCKRWALHAYAGYELHVGYRSTVCGRPSKSNVFQGFDDSP